MAEVGGKSVGGLRDSFNERMDQFINKLNVADKTIKTTTDTVTKQTKKMSKAVNDAFDKMNKNNSLGDLFDEQVIKERVSKIEKTLDGFYEKVFTKNNSLTQNQLRTALTMMAELDKYNKDSGNSMSEKHTKLRNELNTNVNALIKTGELLKNFNQLNNIEGSQKAETIYKNAIKDQLKQEQTIQQTTTVVNENQAAIDQMLEEYKQGSEQIVAFDRVLGNFADTLLKCRKIYKEFGKDAAFGDLLYQAQQHLYEGNKDKAYAYYGMYRDEGGTESLISSSGSDKTNIALEAYAQMIEAEKELSKVVGKTRNEVLAERNALAKRNLELADQIEKLGGSVEESIASQKKEIKTTQEQVVVEEKMTSATEEAANAQEELQGKIKKTEEALESLNKKEQDGAVYLDKIWSKKEMRQEALKNASWDDSDLTEKDIIDATMEAWLDDGIIRQKGRGYQFRDDKGTEELKRLTSQLAEYRQEESKTTTAVDVETATIERNTVAKKENAKVSETQQDSSIQTKIAEETKIAQDKIQSEVSETIDTYDKLKAKLQELYAIGNSMQRHTIVEPGTYWGDNYGSLDYITKEDVFANMKEKWSEILAEEKSYSLNGISAKDGFSGSDSFRRLGREYLSLVAIYEKVGGSLEDLNQKQQKAIKSGIETQRILENQSLAYWEERKALSELDREKYFAYEDLVNQIDPNKKTLQIGGGLLDESMFTEADKSIRDFNAIVIDACQRLGIQLPESIQKSVDEAKRFGEIVNYNKDFVGFDDVNNKYLELFDEIRKGSKTAEQAVEELNQAINNSESAKLHNFNKQYSLAANESAKATEQQAEAQQKLNEAKKAEPKTETSEKTKAKVKAKKEEAQAQEQLNNAKKNEPETSVTTSAFKAESEVVAGVAKSEKESLGIITDYIEQTLIPAINAKTDAFKNEATEVELAIEREKTSLKELDEVLNQVGKDAAQSFADGFNSKRGELVTAIETVIQGVLESIKQSNINDEFFKQGTLLIEQYINGVKAGENDLTTVLRNTLKESINAVISKKKSSGEYAELSKAIIDGICDSLTDSSQPISKAITLNIQKAFASITKVKIDETGIKNVISEAVGKNLEGIKNTIAGFNAEQFKQFASSLAAISRIDDTKLTSKFNNITNGLKSIKDVADSLDSTGIEFLNSLKELAKLGDKLSSVATVIKASKDKINKAKDAAGESKETKDVIDTQQKLGHIIDDNIDKAKELHHMLSTERTDDSLTYTYSDRVGETVTRRLRLDENGNAITTEDVNVDYQKMVKQAADARVEFQKIQQQLDQELNKTVGRNDLYISELRTQLDLLAEEYNRAERAALDFIGISETFINEYGEGSKFTADQFYADVQRESDLAISQNNVKYINDVTKQQQDAYYKQLNADVDTYIQLEKEAYKATGLTKDILSQMADQQRQVVESQRLALETDPELQRIRDAEKEFDITNKLAEAQRELNLERFQDDENTQLKIRIDLVKELTKQYKEARQVMMDGGVLTTTQEQLINGGYNTHISNLTNELNNTTNLSYEDAQKITNAFREQKETVDAINRSIIEQYKSLPKLSERLTKLSQILAINPNDHVASDEFNRLLDTISKAINQQDEFQAALGGDVNLIKEIADQASKIGQSDFFNSNVITTLLKQTQSLSNASKYTQAFNSDVESLVSDIQNLSNTSMTNGQFGQSLRDILLRLQKLKQNSNLPINISVSDENINKKILEINKNLHDNSAMNGNMKRQFKELRIAYQNMLNSDANKEAVEDLNAKLEELKATLYETGQVGKSAFMQFTDRIKSSSAQFLATYFSLQDWIRYIRTAFTTIQELDTALVDLKKTTAMSTQELEKFYYKSNDVAKTMGVTTTEVINQASAWSRLGYNTREAATEMAQVSSLFASISPDMDTDMAQSGLVSLMKAFDVNVVDAESKILDKVNIIGNNFAVTNGNIVSGLERSASSLNAANNSLEESIALFTAGTEITQDAESMGAALRTMSMRIRGYDEDVEDYNMDVETLSGTIANLTKTAKTPGGISLFADKQKQTYKSTYQILKEISEIWNDITDKEQAQLLEKLFAKTRANQGAAILSNFTQAEAAMKKMTESAGSAEKEMENIRSSIDYKLNELKQTWVGILQNLLKRDDLGELLGSATKASESFGNVLIKITPAINSFVKVLGSLLEVIGKIPPSLFETLPSLMIGNKLTKSGIGVDLNKSSTIKSSLLGTSLSAGSQDFKAYSQYLIHTRNALNNVEGAADDAKVAFSKMSNTMQNSVKNANISQASLSTLNKEIKSVSSQTGVFAQTLKALGSTLLTGAIATAIMQLVSAIVSFNSEVQNMAQNAANAFKEETNQFSDYKKRIEDCYDVLNDSNATTEQSVQAHKDLFEIKRELIERYKDEAVNIDLVTDSIKGQTDALEQLEKVSAQAARNKFEAEFNENTTLEKWGSAALNMGKQALLTTYNPYFFFKGVFDSISKNGKDLNAYWDDLTGTNFVDRYQMAIDKYTNFSKTISATTNDTLNEILDSYQSFDVNNGEINITGDVGQVQKDIADIQVSLSKYPGYTEEWSKELANVWEDAYKIDSQYGDAYRADIESRVLTDANANQLRQLVEDKYDAYVEAISGDDQNMIDNAIENFERAIQLVNEANLDPIIQKYIIELYPELTAVDTNDISSQLESSLEKYRNYDVNKYADVIDRANTFSSSYIPDLSEYGWGDGSLIGGAKARTYSNSEGTKAINFTPVITDEEGNVVGVLNSDELYNYAQDVINGVHDDFYNLSIGATFEGETALQDAVDYLQSSRMSFEDPLYKILNGGFNADSFAYDEEAIALLKEYVNQIQYGGDINELIETLVKYGYVARGSAETQQITNIADKLFANTSQGSDHTLYQTYWENIAQLTDEQRQKLINLKIPNDVFYSWEKLMDIINETNFNLDTKIKSTISDSVSQLNTEIKPQFDQLKSAYQAIFTEGYDELTGIGKGMDLSVVNVEMLEAIRKEFADIEEAYGKAFDDDKLNDFFRTLTNVESTAEDVQQAFNDLATEYFYSAEGMKNLNDETAAATEQMLEQMGVINADEVVDAMLQYNNLIGLYGELITAKQNLKSATGDEEVSIQNHIDAILNEITALGYEEEAMEAAKMAAFELAMQEAGLSLNNIDTSADCQAILKIAESCGIAINAIEALRRVESAQKRYEDEGTMGAYYNLKYTKEAAVKEIEDISSSYKPIELAPIDIAWKPSSSNSGGGGSKDASDAGKNEADAYVEAYTKELEQLDWLKQNGFITEKEYLDRFRDLYEKYFKDVTGYAKKFYEEQRKYLEGMKSLYQSAGNAAIYFLKKQIDGYNKEKDKALESLEAQKKAIDGQVKAKQKVIDGINDEIDAIQKANEARQKDIQLQKDLYALEKAQHQRPKLVYNDEKGYHYESDITNIRDTREQVEQDRLDIIIQKKQDQISLIEDEIDRLNAQTDAIDEQIASMEDYYDKLIKGVEEYIQKWEDVLEEETIRQNLELLEELGISMDDLLNLDPNTLDNFRNGFFGVLDQLDAYKTYPEVLDEVAAAMDKVADAADKMNKAMSGGGGGGTKDKDKDKGTTQDTTSGIMVGAMKGAQVGSDTAQLSNSLLGIVTVANELATVMDNTTNTVSTDTQQMANEVVEGTTRMVASMHDIGGAYTGVNTAMDTMSLQVATNIGDIATAFNGLSTSASDTQGVLTGSIIPGIGGSIESLAETTNGKFAELQTTFTTFGDDVATTTSTIVDEQMPTLSESVNSTTEEASSGFDKVKASVENVISAVSSLISKMAELAKQKVSSIISGSSKLSGTAYAGGKYENGSNETALVGEEGYEIVAHRNGTFDIVGGKGAEFSNIRHDDVVFSHKQSEDLLKNGHISTRGHAYAGGKDSHIYTPLSSLDPEKVKMYNALTSVATDTDKMAYVMSDINKSIDRMCEAIAPKNTTKTFNNAPVINGGINISCPGITEQEVLMNIGTELEKTFSGMFMSAYQKSMNR